MEEEVRASSAAPKTLSAPKKWREKRTISVAAHNTNWLAHRSGKNIDGLEADINTYINKRINGQNYRSLALISGTSALHLALKLADIQPGETVFCSDSTY